jgi:hypothetical protein
LVNKQASTGSSFTSHWPAIPNATFGLATRHGTENFSSCKFWEWLCRYHAALKPELGLSEAFFAQTRV